MNQKFVNSRIYIDTKLSIIYLLRKKKRKRDVKKEKEMWKKWKYKKAVALDLKQTITFLCFLLFSNSIVS